MRLPKMNILAAAFCTMAAAGVATNASANFIILNSNSEAFERGAVLGNDQEFTLESGEKLRLMGPNGSTRQLEGPSSGLVGDLPGAESPPVEAFNRALALLAGAGKNHEASGAVRAAKLRPMLDGYAFDKRAKFCFADGGSVTISRSDDSSAAVVTIGPRGGSVASFPMDAGQKSVSVDADDVFGQDGVIHVVVVTPEGSPVGLKTKVTPVPVPQGEMAGDMAGLAMLERGCDEQFEQFAARPVR